MEVGCVSEAMAGAVRGEIREGREGGREGGEWTTAVYAPLLSVSFRVSSDDSCLFSLLCVLFRHLIPPRPLPSTMTDPLEDVQESTPRCREQFKSILHSTRRSTAPIRILFTHCTPYDTHEENDVGMTCVTAV